MSRNSLVSALPCPRTSVITAAVAREDARKNSKKPPNETRLSSEFSCARLNRKRSQLMALWSARLSDSFFRSSLLEGLIEANGQRIGYQALVSEGGDDDELEKWPFDVLRNSMSGVIVTSGQPPARISQRVCSTCNIPVVGINRHMTPSRRGFCLFDNKAAVSYSEQLIRSGCSRVGWLNYVKSSVVWH